MRFFPKSGAVVFYTDWFVRDWAAGLAFGPIIFIRPRAKEDEGLLQHELVHARQFWRTFGLHGILYLACKKYRYNAEVEAYCESIKYSPWAIERFAHFIATKYRLNVTKEEALACLKQCRET